MEAEGRGWEASVDGYRPTVVLDQLGVELRQTERPGSASDRPFEGDVPEKIGRFVVGDELGKGAMGRVVEAHDPELRRIVAVKLMLNPHKVSDAQLARFVSEAQITGQLNHPNIVRIHELGLTPDGQIYFVMPRVEGRSLREVVRSLAAGDRETHSEWTFRRLLSAFVQVCNAVAYAHDRGVLHRDLKPDNVMLGAFGEVLVMDWGVAGFIGDRTERVQREQVERVTVTKTMDGVIIGTPGYISPEQVRGQLHLLDERSDLWSLGAILYEMLTLKPAYEGKSAMSVMVQTVSGPPKDPRLRAPERPVSAELAEICSRAMATNPEGRFERVEQLASAVESVLEGSRRRQEADLRAAEAERLWERYMGTLEEVKRLEEGERILERATPPHTPLREKIELLEVRDRIEELQTELGSIFEAVIRECETGLHMDPDHLGARGFLARAYWNRFLDAEERRDFKLARLYEGRVRAYDPGLYTDLLEGTGAITLHTDPPGARVFCRRYERKGLIWALGPKLDLGVTPLEAAPLPMGSYMLTICMLGMRDTFYPVYIARGRHWYSGATPIPLFSDEEVGEDWVYVPAGPFTCGGDRDADYTLTKQEEWVDGYFVSRLPVTVQLYCDFLNALADRDPDEAWGRVPRIAADPADREGQWWERPKRGDHFSVPEWDQGGHTLDPRRPVCHVSWRDARAFVDWMNIRDGLNDAYQLPHELEWEKAGRGVDARIYPWGDRFDATLCKMRDSRGERPVLERIGAFATDVSVYGVRDMAGSVREWCGQTHFAGDGELRTMRGGAWNTSGRSCRLAGRDGAKAWAVFNNVGFRLVRRTTTDGRRRPAVQDPDPNQSRR